MAIKEWFQESRNKNLLVPGNSRTNYIFLPPHARTFRQDNPVILPDFIAQFITKEKAGKIFSFIQRIKFIICADPFILESDFIQPGIIIFEMFQT